MNNKCLEVFSRAQYFQDSEDYKNDINEAWSLYREERYEDCLEKLKVLPSDEVLFSNLCEKLKNKSVYKTLVKIKEGKADKWDSIKGFSSLITHLAIEIQQGNKEYAVLFESLLSKLYNLI